MKLEQLRQVDSQILLCIRSALGVSQLRNLGPHYNNVNIMKKRIKYYITPSFGHVPR